MSAVLKEQEWFYPLAEEDLAEVMSIERSIYEFPWTAGNFRDSLRAGYSCWVYRDGAQLIGYAVLVLVAGEGHLLNLSVAAALQRRGHGKCLLRHLLQVAAEYGARALYLEVRPSNVAAQRLYARHDFQDVGVRHGYYPAPTGREDALVLSLTL